MDKKGLKTIKAQIIGEEIHLCPYEQKETKMKVLYVKAVQKFAAIGAPLGIPGIIASSVLVSSLSSLKGRVFLRCELCERPLFMGRSDEKLFKEKYNWSNFWGFRGTKEEKVELNLLA